MSPNSVHQSNQDLQRLVPAGLSAAFKILTAWNLNSREQMALLGVPKRLMLDQWRMQSPATLEHDQLERLSHILAIYRSLHTLLPDPVAADDWVKRPNTAPIFGGRSALDLMTSDGICGLNAVRQYLAAEVEG